MNVLSAKVDAIKFSKTMSNIVDYSNGFLDGIQLERIRFNRFLGGYAAETLGKYIDTKARMNPASLHHVYEWNATGSENARLFKFNVDASINKININGSFLPSKTPSPSSGQIFSDKASVMENGIGITITPKNSEVLAFQDEGELVFTRNSIFIEHPGGDEVAGSFGSVVDDFFTNFFTNALLRPLINDLENAKEYIDNFAAGSVGGRSVGVRAGRKYLDISGVVVE